MSDGSAAEGSPEREPAEEEPVEKAPDEKAEPASEADSEESVNRQARLEAAKRRYRATLRNEAETGGGGFSEDYYRSQKPPHW
ncbi:MAG: hypothetical protein ACTH2U_01105 [Brevibacterium sp.]